MTRNTRLSSATLSAVILTGALVSLPPVSLAAAQPLNMAPNGIAQPLQDASASSAAQGRLDKSQFKDVKVSVDNGIATLSGTVSLYEYKADAAKRVLKAKGVTAVRNT